jgi:P pilus assembly chaperone PapD
MPRRLALAILLLGALPRSAMGQGVVVAPHAVYLDHRTRSASITLYNPGADPTEVTISSFYGYPVTDSLGHFMLRVPDSVESGMPSASAWIDAFPRRMTLAPLQRQTVRLLARPPQDMADGEYWSRIMIAAKGGAVQLAGADSANIEVGLSLEVRTIIPLIYRKGALQTSVAISQLRASPAADSLVVRVRLERQGTAAFIGTAKSTLVNEKGAAVASIQQPVAIYYDAEPSFTVPTVGLVPGRYRLRFELSTDRTDIAPESVIRSPAVRDSIEVVLP